MNIYQLAIWLVELIDDVGFEMAITSLTTCEIRWVCKGKDRKAWFVIRYRNKGWKTITSGIKKIKKELLRWFSSFCLLAAYSYIAFEKHQNGNCFK